MENYIKKMISEALGDTTVSPETKKGNKMPANGGVEGASKDGVMGAATANNGGVAGTSKDGVMGAATANNGGVAGASKDGVMGTATANNGGVAGTSKDGVKDMNKPNTMNAVQGESSKSDIKGISGCECMHIKPCDKQSLAMAFVPNQVWSDDLFEPEKALENGTAYPCLYKPFLGGAKK